MAYLWAKMAANKEFEKRRKFYLDYQNLASAPSVDNYLL
jgi:hypothetical protein